MIFTGLPDFQRQQRRMRRDHRRIFFLAAESAARFRLHHANAIFRQTEQRHQRLVHVIRALQRSPHRHAFRLARLRDHSLRLDVKLLLRAGFVFAFHDKIGAGPRAIHVALFHAGTI